MESICPDETLRMCRMIRIRQFCACSKALFRLTQYKFIDWFSSYCLYIENYVSGAIRKGVLADMQIEYPHQPLKAQDISMTVAIHGYILHGYIFFILYFPINLLVDRSWPNCVNAQTYIGFCCPHMQHGTAHLISTKGIPLVKDIKVFKTMMLKVVNIHTNPNGLNNLGRGSSK